MFIGGGPAGTAGGIKVTTFAVLFFIMVTELRGEGAVNIFGKRLSRAVHRQAITVVLIAVAAVVAGAGLLMLLTGENLDRALFECISAFATVGLSTGITADLSVPAQLVLVALMFLGRIGPLTLGIRDRAARAAHPVRVPQRKARHWLDSRSSAATRRAASPKPTPSPSSASAGSAARSPSSSWPAGTEVLGIDLDEELVQSLNGELTQVVRADSTKPEALRQLAVDEFDRVVVAIGGNIAASILTCSALLGMKIPVIWAKAVDDQHGLILEQLGVHHVVYPEKDMGRRVAHLVRGAALDYIEVAPGYALVKAPVPSVIHGVPLGETDLRQLHGVTIAAYQHADEPWRNADNDDGARSRRHDAGGRSDRERRELRAAALSRHWALPERFAGTSPRASPVAHPRV